MIAAADPILVPEDIAAFQRRLGGLTGRESTDLRDRLGVVQEYLADPWLTPDRRVRLRVEQVTIRRLLDERRLRWRPGRDRPADQPPSSKGGPDAR
jgi:hypothetical protein